MTDAGTDDHVRIQAGVDRAGRVAYELLPAKHIGSDRYKVLGTPGLANGCATGDVIAVQEDGTFSVVEPGGNLAIHIYFRPPVSKSDLEALKSVFAPLAGIVEAPPDGRFAVVTVNVSAGFPAVEGAMADWMTGRQDAEWNFGNVYDEAGRPLGWWN